MICHGMKKVRDGTDRVYLPQISDKKVGRWSPRKNLAIMIKMEGSWGGIAWKGESPKNEERWEMEGEAAQRIKNGRWEEHKYEVEVDGREENNCLIA